MDSGDNTLTSGFNSLSCPDAAKPVALEYLWSLQQKYVAYVEKCASSKCEKSRIAALCLKVAKRWLACKDAVTVGDWNCMDVERIDWLPFWSS